MPSSAPPPPSHSHCHLPPRHPGVLRAQQGGCGQGSPRATMLPSGCRDALATPVSIVGPSGEGGGAAYQHRPPAPSPLCLCTVSSGVVFPRYSAAQSCVWGGAGGGGGGALSEPPAQWGPSSGPLTPLPVPIVRARAMPTLRAGRICGGGLWVLQAWPQDWRGLGGRKGGSLV